MTSPVNWDLNFAGIPLVEGQSLADAEIETEAVVSLVLRDMDSQQAVALEMLRMHHRYLLCSYVLLYQANPNRNRNPNPNPNPTCCSTSSARWRGSRRRPTLEAPRASSGATRSS